ncbi:MAG: TRAP transporter permease, partial [Desulfotomaculales bacterium]
MNERVAHPESEPVNAEELLARYDRESDYRRLFGFFARVISAIAIAFSVFQLYTALFGTLDAQLQRAVHLSFALALTYLLYPASRKWSRQRLHWLDVLLA